MALGKNIERLRLRAAESRPALADALGLDPAKGGQRIYALEERDSVKSDLAHALAQHFGMPLEVLLNEDLTAFDDAELDEIKRAYKERGRSAGTAPVGITDKIRMVSPDTRQLIEELIAAESDGELTDAMVDALKTTLKLALDLKRAINRADSDRDLEHVGRIAG